HACDAFRCHLVDVPSSSRARLFFFSSRRRHTRSKRDWSSDVCSSDLMYSMPFNSSTPLLYYNKDMFEAAGITEVPASLPEIAEIGDALMNQGGAQEVLAISIYGWYFEQFLCKQGLEMVDNGNGREEAATKVVFDENGD